MKKLYFLLMVFIVLCSSSYAQQVVSCLPCSGTFNLTQFTPDGWSLTPSTKFVTYGGCVYTVTYDTRNCLNPSNNDIRIKSITLNSGCSQQMNAKGSKTDCQWLSDMQDKAATIMSEFIRSNFMVVGTYRILTPSCFAVYGPDFFSSIDNPSIGCTESCCIHSLLASADSCGIIRMRETKTDSTGTCPLPTSPPRYREGGIISVSNTNYTFVPDVNAVSETINIPGSYVFNIGALVSERYTPTEQNKCKFTYKHGSFNCIPLCKRKLTDIIITGR